MNNMDPYELFNENINLIHYVIHKYNFTQNLPYHLTYDDLFQTGAIGLWQGCNTFDSNKGPFAPYIMKCIYNKIIRELDNGRNKNKILNNSLSLTEPAYRNVDSAIDKEVELQEIIPDNKTLDKIIQSREALKIVKNELDNLSEKAKSIIKMKLVGYSTNIISKKFGVSDSYINRITKEFKEKCYLKIKEEI